MIEHSQLLSLSSAAETKRRLLAEWFHVRETNAQCHIHLLLDDQCPVSAEHPLHAHNLQTRPVAREQRRIGKAPADSANDVRPIAMQLYAPGESGYVDELLIDLSIACAHERAASVNGAYVAAWVVTEKPLASFAAHLERCSEVFDMNIGRSRKLPLYQPHRIELLAAQSETPSALMALMHGVACWSFVDASGEVRQVGAGLAAAEAVSPTPALRIGNAQGAMQSRVPLARRVLVGLREAGIDVPPSPAPTIDRFLRLAEDAGLRDAEDQIFFVLNSVSMSPVWHEHPTARAAISASVQSGAPLASVLSELDDAAIEAIAAHLAKDTHSPHAFEALGR